MSNTTITSKTKVEIGQHFKEQMAKKGFTGAQVIDALRFPYKVTNVRRHPGQKRFCSAEVAVVAAPIPGGWKLVTLYADGVVTPLRADQKHDPEALRSIRLAGAR